ncbi:MAG: hypothetical protein J2P40_15810 [Candidatus Dormibacteraeota bacterium]|nr:hypothetical protein [Candidatus Dormibacteraeota bacterium]MBO0762739.1 hypothetical protein [Candidatus Dormibacteraeota bacterium]
MDTDPSPHSETAEYLAEVVAAAGEAAEQLPSAAPAGWRRTAYRAVLAAILRDWTENGTASLDPQDTANMHGFVRDAAEAALGAPEADRDDAFEVVLGALLDDWILNWNSEEGYDDEEDEEELDDLDLAYDESEDDPDLDADGDEEGSNRDGGLPAR